VNTGNINITLNTPNILGNSSSGALLVSGGAGIVGNLTVGGNVDINGNLYVDSGFIITSTSRLTIGNSNPVKQGGNTVTIGVGSGTNNQGGNSIAIGSSVGVGTLTTSGVGFSSIVIGSQTDVSSNFATSIGSYNTHTNSNHSLIIGSYSEATNAGNSIVIGSYATCLSGNSICINATGYDLTNTSGPGTCVIAPIRLATDNTYFNSFVYYNTTTNELFKSSDTYVKYSSNSTNNDFPIFFSGSSSASDTDVIKTDAGLKYNPSSNTLILTGPIISKNINLPSTTQIGNIISVDGVVFSINPSLTNNFFNVFGTNNCVTLDVSGVWLLNWNIVVDGSVAPGNVFFGLSTNSQPTVPSIGISKTSVTQCNSFSPAFAINGSYTVFSRANQSYYLYGNVTYGTATIKGNTNSYFNALRIA
jgi:hypothetical protein